MMMYFPGMNIFSNQKQKLAPFVEKMNNGELTLEDILSEDLIIQDLKDNTNSKFVDFFTNEKIKKLIDYSTKLPASDEHNIAYKYPFNAMEILSSENANIQKKLMSEKITEKSDDISLINSFQQGKFIYELFKVISKTNTEMENENNENEEDNDELSESSDEDNSKDDSNEENIRNNIRKEKIIYENIDYLLGFLNESNETKENYVLSGYFYKILSNLINVQALKIVQYLYEYPNKSENDILDLLVKNMNRKGMCTIVQKLLLYEEESSSSLEDNKMDLLEKVLKELNDTNDKDKYEFICESLSFIFSNKSFFDLFMKKPFLLELLYNILINSKNNSQKTVCLLKLLIKMNDNILQHFDVRFTPITQENNAELLPNLDIYNSNNKSLSSPDEGNNTENFINFLFTFFNVLVKSNLSFLDDLGSFSEKENAEFIATYKEPQKKIGMKKVIKSEFIKSILDILVNAYASGYHKSLIEQLLNIAKGQNIFWNLHNLLLLFPHSNIYQIYYNQIIDIVINDNSPNCLIDYFFIDNIANRNLPDLLMESILNNLKFNFKLTKTPSFNPCFSFIVTILNKIFKTLNTHLISLIDKNKDLNAFNEIIGKEVEEIFSQRLLLTDQGLNFGENQEQEEVLSSFLPKSFLELVEDDYKIYDFYKKGENYETMLNEKKEKMENSKKELQKNRNQTEKVNNIDDLDEEEDDTLFRIEKINLANEKDNFLAMLNKPVEDIYKVDDKENKKEEKVKTEEDNKIEIKELEDDEEKDIILSNEQESEKEKETINTETENINEDLIPNSLYTKHYEPKFNTKSTEGKLDPNESDD